MLTDKEKEFEMMRHAEQKNGFWFRGEHSSEYHLFVEKYPDQKSGTRRRTTFKIPGRNGDLHAEENAYDNYQVPYACYFHSPDPTPDAVRKLLAWLNQPGYSKLYDNYGTEFFRYASFVGPLDVENRLNKYGRCTIYFDCAPQCYLWSGQDPYVFDSPSFIVNPTRFNAKPLIVVYGTGPGTVTVGNKTVEIKALEDVIILDSETENAYRQVGDAAAENKNASVYAPDFPELEPGENPVSWDGDITSVMVTPRWWTL